MLVNLLNIKTGFSRNPHSFAKNNENKRFCLSQRDIHKVIGVCTDTYAFYQSVLEKKKDPIGQVYRKGRNVTSQTSQTPVVSMTTRLIAEE